MYNFLGCIGTAGQDYDDFCLNSNSRPCCTTANLPPIPLEEYKFILNPSLSAILRFYSTAGVLGKFWNTVLSIIIREICIM